jgi:ribonuclease-3
MHTHPATQEVTYDRLEFLGDAYIEVMATRLIWGACRSLPAGRMSQIRELLVKNETLNEYALLYGFDKRLKAQDFQREDPKRWLKIVADVFEAYVAAVILSDPVSGFKSAEEWLVQLWQPKLKDVKTSAPNLKAKEELARNVMAKGIKLHYRDEAPMEQLKGGMQTYFIGVYLTGWGWEELHLGSGSGLSKVAAGNEAAAAALENKPIMEQITAKRNKYLEEQKMERERGSI